MFNRSESDSIGVNSSWQIGHSNRFWQNYESSARSYPESFPITFSAANGGYLIAEDGRQYLDFLTSAGVHVLGHNHPRVTEAIRNAQAPLLSSLDLATTAKGKFVEAFLNTLPKELQDNYKIHFCGPTGSDAVEAGLKLARIATKRNGIFAFTGSYHGMTQGALGVTSCVRLRQAGLRVRDDITFCPFPYPFRGIGPMKDAENAIDYALAHLEMLLADDHSGCDIPSMLLLEFVQGEGGNVVAPQRFVAGIKNICERFGILLGVDEIQTGMGRTGRWYSFEHYGVTPDLFMVSKGIGGGLPMSLLILRRDLDVWHPGDHIGTFRGQGLAFAAGTATIETITNEGLLDNATKMGNYLRIRLDDLKTRHACVGEVRGLGLFIGLECVETKSMNANIAAKFVQAKLLSSGIILERGGREGSVLRFLPPINVTKLQLDFVVDTLDEIFQSLCSQ